MAKSATSTIVVRPPRAGRARHHRRTRAAPSLAILMGFAPTLIYAYQGLAVNGPYEAVTRAMARITGYSMTERKWKLNELIDGWGPILLGIVAHKVANKTGLNRSVRKITMGLLSI